MRQQHPRAVGQGTQSSSGEQHRRRQPGARMIDWPSVFCTERRTALTSTQAGPAHSSSTPSFQQRCWRLERRQPFRQIVEGVGGIHPRSDIGQHTQMGFDAAPERALRL